MFISSINVFNVGVKPGCSFDLTLACKLKKLFFRMSWSNGAVCPGGAKVRFVHFWCPRFVTLANVEYLEVLLDLKIKFAGAIETKKYDTNP